MTTFLSKDSSVLFHISVPIILDNPQRLLIQFKLVGSEVRGEFLCYASTIARGISVSQSVDLPLQSRLTYLNIYSRDFHENL